jgi:hypothetical protein
MPDFDETKTEPEIIDEQNRTALARVRNLIADLKSVEDYERLVGDDDFGHLAED